MDALVEDFSTCNALVADSNANSRAVIVNQLRALGIGQIVQCIRTADARRRLEAQDFDFVICEMHFTDEAASGQELLDDLRRNHLLPFSTVFVMVTGETAYVKVAEAAESALDGYLLKPHKATQLEEKLLLARARKRSLQAIFDAIADQQFELAALRCVERFESRGAFWLYAGRVGAELLMRLSRYVDAQALFETIVAFKPLPWARLGVARTHLERGHAAQACTLLEALLVQEPDFAQALDVLGRAQFELGIFDRALSTFLSATYITPTSISRLQSAGMMYFYCGQTREAEPLLERATRLGLESKLFDPQTLVLLAIARLEHEDRRGLLRCADELAHLMDRNPDNSRLPRLVWIVHLLQALQRHDIDTVQNGVADMAAASLDAEFDFECAASLLALVSHMQLRGTPCHHAQTVVQTLALRYCSNRPLTDMLLACAQHHPPYQEQVQAAYSTVLRYAEQALLQVRTSDPATAIGTLLAHAHTTRNVRLIDNALQLLQKYEHSIADPGALHHQALALRELAGAGNRRLALGQPGRQPGGMVLRQNPRTRAPLRVSRPDPAAADSSLSEPPPAP